MLHKLHKAVFFLIIFFLPFQVGLHFWPTFSYINGVRVDYLSPTLYLLDILIVGWIVLNVRAVWEIRAVWGGSVRVVFLLLALSLAWNIFAAKSPEAHVFGIFKLGEFGLFGWLVARTFKKDYIPGFVRILSFSALVSSILAIWQFINQSSGGSIWYFLGERTFNVSTIGISTVNLEHQFLRPYGAFPHPNILAFFLLITNVFVTCRFAQEKTSLIKIVLLFSVLISTIGLILTFSRISILLTVCFLLYIIFTNVKSKAKVLGLMGLVSLLGFVFFSNVFKSGFLLRGIDFRLELLIQSFKIFLDSIYFGIGLNNFFIHQAPIIKNISPILYQPPHNIFILTLLSLGLFGWWIVPVGMVRAVREVWARIKESKGESKDFYRSTLFLLIAVIVVGTFDHFFLTLEQGQIMFALILGLAFAKLRK